MGNRLFFSHKHVLKKTEQNFQEHICNLEYTSRNINRLCAKFPMGF